MASTVKVALFLVWCSCCCVLVCPESNDTFLQDCQHQEMDVVFVQDASYSVGNNSFETAKSFIANIVRQLPIGLDLVRVALVRFSSEAHVIAKLSQSRDVSSVTQAIAGMAYRTGGTQTGLALKTVRTQVLDAEQRPDARTVVVVITDGESVKFRDTRMEARKLRRANVRLVWLYINASDADIRLFDRERKYMAREGDTTLAAASFQDLDEESRREILHASCKEDPVPETTTTTTKSTTTTMKSTTTTTKSTTTTTSTVTPTSHPTKTSPTYPSPAITDSDADVTEPATSPTDDEESTSSLEASSEETATSPLPKSSPTRASTYVRPSESETVANTAVNRHHVTKASKTSKAASDFHTTHREPATSEPITSTSSITRKPTTETNPGSTSLPDMTTQGRSPSTSGGEQKEEEDSDSTDSKESGNRASTSGRKGAGAFEDIDWNIVGPAVGSGLVVIAAISSACIYYALRRRRRDEREKNKPTSDA